MWWLSYCIVVLLHLAEHLLSGLVEDLLLVQSRFLVAHQLFLLEHRLLLILLVLAALKTRDAVQLLVVTDLE